MLQEYQTTLELNNKLQIQNTIFTQRNQDLEINQKSFIQRLGGIVYKENLEDKTWDLVLDKVQVLMNERNEAVIKIQAINRDFEVIKQKNELLIKEKDTFNQSLEVLKSIIATKENEINSLTPKLRCLEFRCEELVKDLQFRTDNNIELEQMKNELKKLQDVIIQKDSLIQSLEIKKGENLQKISLLEASVNIEKSNCELLTQEKVSLHSRVQQLEREIQVLNDKPIDSDIEMLEFQIAQKDNNIKKLEDEKNQNIQKIKQLEINIAEKELELKITIQNSNNRIQELKDEIDFLKQLPENIVDSLIEKLRKQITQKDAVIKKLESEKSEIIESFNKFRIIFNEKEYQLELVQREKFDLDNRVKELEEEKYLLIQKLRDKESEISELKRKISELEQDLSLMSQYADDIEQYAEDLEQYYLEELETYTYTSNINELEELQKQIDEKDTCIRRLKVKLENCSDFINITEVEYRKKQIDKKDAYILNLKLSHDAEIDIDLNIISSLENSLYEEQRNVKHLRGVIRKLKKCRR
ncbi:hypothetical protein [Anabaena lutea]|uniref:Uncharacterized protein n=1 Tax=Anabaena lutea FACHB-196 TaxID=2692881 RepID=A0ABR8FL06_9NOST|nr:hypothetical protein [Anabaena lutea]MBD2570799.1 hypothetical protein [Anabaena lutea FACHB-196]